ncbi:MAG: SPOR domain-containing protein, partial [Rhodosalinus sp.]
AGRAPAAVAGARCPGGTPVSRRYLAGREGERLRCGPQAKPPYSFRIPSAAEAEALPEGARIHRHAAADADDGAKVYRSVSGRAVSGEARVLPRHLWQPPQPEEARVEVPDGYEPAWDDGRLNPRRAEQTLNGRERMLLVWTNTTPRRLIDRASGEDVTARHPRLFYPFTDLATQNAYLSAKDELEVRVAQDGRVRLVQKTDGQADVATRSAPVQPAAPRAQPVREAPPAAPEPRAAAPHRFVQVGTFGEPANAQRTAARLQAMGLPVRLSRMSRGGRSYRIVLAGPFTSEARLRDALGTARRAGFADAFPRN